MLKYAICVLLFVAGMALSACSQSSTATSPLGPTGMTQPSHRVRPDATSTSVTIRNNFGVAIALVGVSASCLTGSPPSSVPGTSTSSPFSVSYTGSCAGDTGHFNMTYDPDAALADACTFKVDYAIPTGAFTYAVSNNGNTNCSYALGGAPETVQFIYSQ